MKSLEELMLIIKKTNLANDAHIGPKRLNRLLLNPGLFTIEDAHKIADLVGVTGKHILDLLDAEYILRQKSKKKK